MALAALLWIGGVAAAVHSEFHKRGVSLSRARPLPGNVCPGLVVGVNSSLGSTDKTPSESATVAAIQKTLHAQVVRVSLRWDQVEPAQGKFDWSRLDDVVANLRAAGIEPVFVVVGSPSWANGMRASKRNQYLYVPPRGAALSKWLRNYSSFLALAVKRYDRFVRRWEIWNEPNLAATWRPRPDPAEYVSVYERLRNTIVIREPQAQVAVGGLGDPSTASAPNVSGLAFLRALIRAQAPLDNVAIQPFTSNDHPPGTHVSGQNNFDDIEQVHKLLVRHGVRAAMWVTAWGWPSTKVGAERQAQYVDRSMSLLENRYPFVRLAAYSLDHDVPPVFSQGLLSGGLKPKPAAVAFRAHADLAAIRCSTETALAGAPGRRGQTPSAAGG